MQFQRCCFILLVVVKEPVAGPSVGQQLRQLLKEALQMLEEEGVVFRKVKSQDEVYHVRQNRELFHALFPLLSGFLLAGLKMNTCLFDGPFLR